MSPLNAIRPAGDDTMLAVTLTHSELLAQIDAIAPELEAASSENEKLGQIAPHIWAHMKALRLSTLFVPRDMGGYGFTPTEAIQVLEKITYHDSATGWVAFVHACAGCMAAGYLPQSAIDKLFAPGTTTIICGAGAPTGVAEQVPGGYRVTGRWSYGSGIKHADYVHSGAILKIDGKPQFDEKGRPIVVCVHPAIADVKIEGNWDVLGLKGTGSVDYSVDGVFCPEDFSFRIFTAEPKRDWGFFQLGVVGISAIGHSSVAIGIARRMLDELTAFARTKTGRSGMIGESEAFWQELGRNEARVRAARAFLLEAWRDAEVHILNDTPISTREMTLLRLALLEAHHAGAQASEFAYRSAGGTSLRNGTIQRLFREMYTAVQHMTVSPTVLSHCGRDLLGVTGEQVWRFYEIVDPD